MASGNCRDRLGNEGNLTDPLLPIPPLPCVRALPTSRGNPAGVLGVLPPLSSAHLLAAHWAGFPEAVQPQSAGQSPLPRTQAWEQTRSPDRFSHCSPSGAPLLPPSA